MKNINNVDVNNGKLSIDIVHLKKTSGGKTLKDEKCVCLRFQGDDDIRETSIILSQQQAIKVINSLKKLIDAEN